MQTQLLKQAKVAPSTLVGWIDYHARRTPKRVAIQQVSGATLTYRELADRVTQLATVLRHHGVVAGDRVAVLARNDHRIFEVQYACARIGAVMVPLNWRLSDAELADITDDFQPRVVFHDAPHRQAAHKLCTGLGIEFQFEWSDAASNSYDQALAAVDAESTETATTPDAPWIIIYTSGTTGRPKGVVHTIESVRANLENSILCGDIGSNTVSLTTLPMFHVAGLHLFSGDVLRAGGQLIILKEFDAEEVLQRIWDTELGVTHFSAVPTIFQLMTKTEIFRSGSSRPFLAAVGGSPVPGAVLDAWRNHGTSFIKVYGASEAGSTVVTTSPDSKKVEATAAGLHAATVEYEIRTEGGAALPAGQTGELWLRGPSLMKHYWNRPEASQQAVDAKGWYRTGDVARVDGTGMLHIVDRIKDMYISGGENIYPAEVENLLYTHPSVLLISVLGVANEKWGEVGCAFVVLKPGQHATAEGLKKWCRQKMAPYKIPAQFEFVEELPRNGTGKIMKSAIREAFAL